MSLQVVITLFLGNLKLLNNTQQCDSSGYCDKILQPYTKPASTVTVNEDVNLTLGFHNQTAKQMKRK